MAKLIGASGGDPNLSGLDLSGVTGGESGDSFDLESSKAPSVTRAAMILALLARSREPAGLNAIARELGLISSTCLHILRALEQAGFVALDPVTKRYSLGLGLVGLGVAALRSNPFAEAVVVELRRLSQRFRATTSALQLDKGGRAFVVIAVESISDAFCVQVEVGRALPLYMSAMGRCYAAYSGKSDAELRAVFNRLEWDEAPDFATWLGEIQEVREGMIGVDRGNYVRGFEVRTAPVFEQGRPTRGISCVFAKGQFDHDELAALSRELQIAAGSLSDLAPSIARKGIAGPTLSR
jgi:DNA-binding IclR family transcriptional regulator